MTSKQIRFNAAIGELVNLERVDYCSIFFKAGHTFSQVNNPGASVCINNSKINTKMFKIKLNTQTFWWLQFMSIPFRPTHRKYILRISIDPKVITF